MTKPKLTQFTKFHLALADKLVGKMVSRAVVSDGAVPGDLPIVGLQFADRTIAWILCDEEGNGPGVLDIQEPEKK